MGANEHEPVAEIPHMLLINPFDIEGGHHFLECDQGARATFDHAPALVRSRMYGKST